MTQEKESQHQEIGRWLSHIRDEGVNLTDWEQKFISNITMKFESGYKLSDVEVKKIESIYTDRTP